MYAEVTAVDNLLTVKDNAIAALNGQIGTYTAEIADLRTQLAVAQAPKPPVHVSGIEPERQQNGWTEIFFEDFAKPCDEGQFLLQYPQWGAYAKGWTDTQKNAAHAQYSGADFCSVSDDRLKVRLWTPPTGYARVTALSPNLGAGYSSFRWSAAFRYVQNVPGYHPIPILGWPKDEQWPLHGEIDFPEGDSGMASQASAFWHFARLPVANSPSQDGVLLKRPLGETWHRIEVAKVANQYVSFVLDGELVLRSQNYVGSAPMRWVMQLESAGVLNPGSEMQVEFDWVRIATQ
jgi:hypothetical protein